jgi:hypothetical protein
MKVEQMITVGRGVLAALEVLEHGLEVARTALKEGKFKLQDALTDAEKMHEQIAVDRAAADKALEDKFK